jgi:hypothetical protein
MKSQHKTGTRGRFAFFTRIRFLPTRPKPKDLRNSDYVLESYMRKRYRPASQGVDFLSVSSLTRSAAQHKVDVNSAEQYSAMQN